jgi:L-ascorbate metabolism protein UlaG (beta-lactamase superfamily)
MARGPPASGPGSPVRSAGSTVVTYFGHATILIQSGGEAILTDPVFCNRIGRFFTKRATPCEFHPETLPRLSAVLISHPHHDPLDFPSLKRLQQTPPLVVPWGLGTTMRWRGFPDVRVTRPWESTRVGAWTVTAVPSRHFGGRLPLVGTSAHLGFVLSGPTCIYFAGDTGFHELLFREIARRFPIDLAILPIAGAVFPWYRRNHMNAEDALKALPILGAEQMLPMHYGTFPASFEAADEPLKQLVRETQRRGWTERIRILRDGESFSLPGSPPREAAVSWGVGPRPDAFATA